MDVSRALRAPRTQAVYSLPITFGVVSEADGPFLNAFGLLQARSYVCSGSAWWWPAHMAVLLAFFSVTHPRY